MDGESGPLKMWQIWALYDIAADFYADPENQAAFEAWQKQREKCKKTKRPCRGPARPEIFPCHDSRQGPE